MLNILRKIYALLPMQRQRQILWLTSGMFVMGFVELGLAGGISLLGVALADPSSLEKIGPLGKLLQMLPPWGDDIPLRIKMLILVMGIVSFATLAKNVMTAIMTYWLSLVSQRVSWDIGAIVFDNYLFAPYIWHTQRNPVELGGCLRWRLYAAAYMTGALQIISQFSIMLFLMVGAFVLAPLVSLLLYGVTACASLIMYKASQKKARKTGELISQLSVDNNKVVLSALYGIREVHIYNQQRAFYKHFTSYAEQISKSAALQSMYPPLPHWVLESVGMFLLFASVLFMSWQGNSIVSITGTLTLMAAISWRLLPALNKIVGGILQLKANVAPIKTLLSEYLVLPRVEGTVQHKVFAKALELRDVSFTYPQANGDALQKIDLKISKGSMVGLIGLSGAGKSTLVGVLTGLLTPQKGQVLLDGNEVLPSPGFLKIGYVPQNPYIIDADLAENVAFCDWGKKPDEARVRRCCQMAAMDFLDDLPQGIHTVLGDRGVRLSGGQVQRVAIARALYGDPDIMLFDEATSALDGAAEAAIQKTILSLSQEMTVVIVAHRLSTIKGCNSLYWLDGGAVRMSGSVDEILSKYERFLEEYGKEDSIRVISDGNISH